MKHKNIFINMAFNETTYSRREPNIFYGILNSQDSLGGNSKTVMIGMLFLSFIALTVVTIDILLVPGFYFQFFSMQKY